MEKKNYGVVGVTALTLKEFDSETRALKKIQDDFEDGILNYD